MNPLTVVLLSFVIVAGVTVLAAMALLRFWPVVQRGRLATPAGESGGAESILRWSEQLPSGWQRTVERIQPLQQNGDAVQLGAVRAAGRPHPEPALGREQRRQELALE